MEILEEDGQIIFRVTDKGDGILEEIEALIFTPFFTTKGIGKGTGLGFSISKTIMKGCQVILFPTGRFQLIVLKFLCPLINDFFKN